MIAGESITKNIKNIFTRHGRGDEWVRWALIIRQRDKFSFTFVPHWETQFTSVADSTEEEFLKSLHRWQIEQEAALKSE
jgi:hypothetical protein